MTEIIIKNEIYQEVNADFYSESDFEALVIKHLPNRVSEDSSGENKFFCCEMKLKFDSQPENTVPDLIVFDKNLSSFWIVEVELSKHGWNSHVHYQMLRIERADYSKKANEVFKIVTKEFIFLRDHKKRFISLIENQEPKYLLVINRTPSWKDKFNKSGLKSSYIEIRSFVNRNNDFIFQFEGDYLKLEEEFSEMTPSSYYFEIKNPHIFDGLKDNETICCKLEDKELFFTLKKSKSSVALFPMGRECIEFMRGNRMHHIFKITKDNFEIRRI